MQQFLSKKYDVVFGLGISGQSTLRFLNAQKSAPLIAIDTREQLPAHKALVQLYPEVNFQLGAAIALPWKQVSRLIVSPGIPLQHEIIQQAYHYDIPVLGDLEIFAHTNQQPLAAITGSNGKTTVTQMVGEMSLAAGFKTSVGGNIGRPVLDLLTDHSERYILECSSFQLETTSSLRSHVACLLNISADHLDRHGNIENYLQAKHRVFERCQVAIFNRDCLETKPNISVPKLISFGLNNPKTANDWGISTIDNQVMLMHADTVVLPISQMKSQTHTYIANSLAAAAIAHHLEIPYEAICSVLQSFQGLAHRFQSILRYNEVEWINDSKATNIGATLSALNNLKQKQGRVILILGGDAKGADLSELLAPVKAVAKYLILIGTARNELAEIFSGHMPCVIVNTMNDAVDEAYKQAVANDIILLSPACASLDMFKNYEQRGNQFSKRVLQVAR